MVPELKMQDRLSRWGVGPRIALAALTYAALAGATTRRWPDACRILFVPYSVFVSLGSLVLVIGVAMLVFAARSATKAYNHDQLVLSGVFALVRHPIYSAWIVLILPGLALFSRSWPQMLTPLVACTVFKLSIRREDEYLRQRFGDVYLDYRARVSELIPIPRLWRRTPKQNAI